MTEKRFRTALFRWSVLAGLIVAAFWGVWMQFAPMPPYAEPLAWPRVWWADALLMSVLVNVTGWAFRGVDRYEFPLDTAELAGDIIGALLGGVIGLFIGASVGLFVCDNLLPLVIACFIAGLAVGASIGIRIAGCLRNILRRIAPVRVAHRALCFVTHRLYDFLCAKNVQ